MHCFDYGGHQYFFSGGQYFGRKRGGRGASSMYPGDWIMAPTCMWKSLVSAARDSGIPEHVLCPKSSAVTSVELGDETAKKTAKKTAKNSISIF